MNPNTEKADIFCPKCEWKPQSEDRWECVPSCGTVWNTFWTRAVCPGCGVKWPSTQCFECEVFSPHDEWYHYREPESEERDAQTAEERHAT